MNIQLKAHREMFYGNFSRSAESLVIMRPKPHHGNCTSIAVPYRLKKTQQNKGSLLGKTIIHGGSANSMSPWVGKQDSETSGNLNHRVPGISPETYEKLEIVAGFEFSRWSRPITRNILESI